MVMQLISSQRMCQMTENFQRPKPNCMSGTVGNSLTPALSLQIQLVLMSSSISWKEHNQFIRDFTLHSELTENTGICACAIVVTGFLGFPFHLVLKRTIGRLLISQ